MSTDPSQKEDAHPADPEKSVSPAVANDGRRRFTKAGLAASGVLMTLSSRSLLAAEEMSTSGFGSANQSRHGERRESRARRPYYWTDDCHWTKNKDLKFRDVFHQCTPGSPYYQFSCHDVVTGKVAIDTTAHHCVGQYLVAAYLNAHSGLSDGFFSMSDCINLGNEWLTTGEFHPTANVTWNCQQIVQYFQHTQS